MADRIIVQVQFKKALWVCPACAQEDIEDMNPAGGNTYEHNCSRCNTWFNSFKEYNGNIQYTKEQFDSTKAEDVVAEKTRLMATWVNEIKNPPAYVEPTKAELEQLKAEKQAEVDALQNEITAKEQA